MAQRDQNIGGKTSGANGTKGAKPGQTQAAASRSRPKAAALASPGAKVQLYQALDGSVSLYYGDTRLQHTLAPPG